MAEIVNLRQTRKRKRRDAAAKQAAENRTAHGRTAAERREGKRLGEIAARRLEGHKRDKPEE